MTKTTRIGWTSQESLREWQQGESALVICSARERAGCTRTSKEISAQLPCHDCRRVRITVEEIAEGEEA